MSYGRLSHLFCLSLEKKCVRVSFRMYTRKLLRIVCAHVYAEATPGNTQPSRMLCERHRHRRDTASAKLSRATNIDAMRSPLAECATHNFIFYALYTAPRMPPEMPAQGAVALWRSSKCVVRVRHSAPLWNKLNNCIASFRQLLFHERTAAMSSAERAMCAKLC